MRKAAPWTEMQAKLIATGFRELSWFESIAVEMRVLPNGAVRSNG
jgi:hypothetical protein